MQETEDFFNSLQQYDWAHFDQIASATEQSAVYFQMLDRFSELIAEAALHTELNLNELDEYIRNRQSMLAALPFMGKFHTVVNPHLLSGQLLAIVHKISFDKEKSNLIDTNCDCQLRHKYSLNPEYDHLEETGCGSDGYYDYTRYTCKHCSFIWVSYIKDDDTGNITYEKWEHQFTQNK